MARIRTLKPDIWSDEDFGRLSLEVQKTFLGLITQADDEGRLACNLRILRVAIFPYDDNLDDDDFERFLFALADAGKTVNEPGMIRLYENADRRYIDLPTWTDHQKINRPTPSIFPAFEDSVICHGGLTEDSLKNGQAEEAPLGDSTHGGLTEDSLLDRKGRERKGGEGSEPADNGFQRVFGEWQATTGQIMSDAVTQSLGNLLRKLTRRYQELDVQCPPMLEPAEAIAFMIRDIDSRPAAPVLSVPYLATAVFSQLDEDLEELNGSQDD